METGRWRRIQELFHEAADIAPAARPAFLSQACGGDQELRRDVESLLASDIPSEAAFRSAVDQAVAILPTDTEDSAEFVGTKLQEGLLKEIARRTRGEYLPARRDVPPLGDWFARAIEALQAVVHKEPGQSQFQQYLRDAHWGRAETLADLARHAEAVRDWDRALALDGLPHQRW